MSAPIDVAVAVLTRGDGRVLLARRPRGKVYAGYWEFPGGKVEPGETVRAALDREIREELAIGVERAYPWITQVFDYPHARVRLHFFRVTGWHGEPHAHEHEAIAWEDPRAVAVEPLLPANGPVLRALQLPNEYAISSAASLGRATFLARLERRLSEGLRLVQMREPLLSREEVEPLAIAMRALTRAAGAKLLVNSDPDLACRIGADGIHLNSRQLRMPPWTPGSRPEALPLIGASCHGAGELRLAEDLGADFAVLGPVRATPSHPNAQPIGWARFAEIACGASIPVYALGGIETSDLESAWERGAHGIAMVRAAWRGLRPHSGRLA